MVKIRKEGYTKEEMRDPIATVIDCEQCDAELEVHVSDLTAAPTRALYRSWWSFDCPVEHCGYVHKIQDDDLCSAAKVAIEKMTLLSDSDSDSDPTTHTESSD